MKIALYADRVIYEILIYEILRFMRYQAHYSLIHMNKVLIQKKAAEQFFGLGSSMLGSSIQKTKIQPSLPQAVSPAKCVTVFHARYI